MVQLKATLLSGALLFPLLVLCAAVFTTLDYRAKQRLKAALTDLLTLLPLLWFVAELSKLISVLGK